ncbi:MAG: hypothetical protein HZB91_09985 [Elusimicrobia bacterium]|nr:hypothetical protein [Elusimicrobiota bacterium]
MKKLLGSVLAIAMLVQPGVASAELLKNFKLSGGVDLQTQASRNVLDFVTRQDPKMNDAGGNLTAAERPSFNDRANDAQFRILVSMDWDILDDVHAKVTIGKNDRAWGTAGTTAESPLYTGLTAKQTVGVGGGANILGQLDVEQAYLKIDKVFGFADATVGRQYFGEQGDLIIYYGPQYNLYGQPVNALDAARVDIFGLPYVNITGLAGKAVGTLQYTATNNGGSGADQDIRGFNVQLKDVENIGAEFFLYNRLTHARGALGYVNDDIAPALNGGGRNDYLTVYGLRGKVNFGGFTGKVLFAKNNGANRAVANVNWDKNQNGAYNANLDAKGNPTSATEQYITPSASYSGWAWTIDAEYKAEIEDIASFTPWMHLGMGTGRNSLADAKNQGFTSINSDYRPGTIYGRFGQFLGAGIPCIVGAVGCGALTGAATDVDGDGTINGLGTRTQGTHMGAANVGGVGLNNRVIWGLGLKTTPAFAPKLTMGLSWYQFRFQKITDDKIVWQSPTVFDATRTASFATSPRAVYCNGTTCYARLPNSGASTGAPDMGHYYDGQNNTQGFSNGQNQKHIGDEIDIDFTWKHSDNVSFLERPRSARTARQRPLRACALRATRSS